MTSDAHSARAVSAAGAAAVTDAEYRLLVESVRDYAIFLLDPEGHVRSWNPGAERLKGWRAEEVIGRSVSMFYPEDQLARGRPGEELREALRLGRLEEEGWRLRKDGSRFWASVAITAVFDAQGHHRGFAKVTRDLSVRRAHEELLRRSEERFRLMVEGVRDYAIFMLDPDGHIASWNLGAQLTKGYTAEEIVGQHFSVFYPQEQLDKGWPQHELELAIRDGRYEEEGWRLRKDGSRFWASVVITALYDEHGRHSGFAKVTRDMTERRRISALESQEKHLYQFLAVLGHELRNPLAPITNATAILQLEQAPSQNVRYASEILGRQVRHLSRLVDDLLDVGRIVSGKVHLQREPMCLRNVVHESAEAAEPLMRARRHDFRVEMADEPLWVAGDKVRLVQVLNNLLNNAAKFSPEGGSVRLALQRQGGMAELAVRDNGPGIEPAQLREVFKLFVQGEQDSARLHGGLGIGLGMAHQIVQRHGGEISAFSTGVPGQGAEFVVRLPLIEPPAAGDA